MKAQPQVYPHLDLSYSASEPITQPVILNLPANGTRLRFDGPDQRLRLIEVLDFSHTLFTYKNIELVRRPKSSEEGATHDDDNHHGHHHHGRHSSSGPSFRHIYNRLFGPAYAGEYVPPDAGHAKGTYVLSYPGLAFSFPVRHQSWSDQADFVSILSSTATGPALSMALFSGSSWPEARATLYIKVPTLPRSSALAGKNFEAVPDEVEEVRVFGGGKIELARRSTAPMTIILGETTPQDLVAELGPPDAIYRKHDRRISIHAAGNASDTRRPSMSPGLDPQGVDTDQSSIQSYTEDSDADAELNEARQKEVSAECFYNYFHHGFDALVSFPTARSQPFPGQTTGAASPSLSSSSSAQVVVTKLFLHANVPGSFAFNRHRRCRWVISTRAQDEDSNNDDSSRSSSSNNDDDEINKSSTTTTTLTSEMPFSQISSALKQIWHNTYQDADEERRMQRGMVLNRGWGESPESSIELLGGFEESLAPHRPSDNGGAEHNNATSTTMTTTNAAGDGALNNTELFGFPGLLFEVLKNDTVSCLTVF